MPGLTRDGADWVLREIIRHDVLVTAHGHSWKTVTVKPHWWSKKRIVTERESLDLTNRPLELEIKAHALVNKNEPSWFIRNEGTITHARIYIAGVHVFSVRVDREMSVSPGNKVSFSPGQLIVTVS